MFLKNNKNLLIICAVTILLSGIFGFLGAYFAVGLTSENRASVSELYSALFLGSAECHELNDETGRSMSIPEIYDYAADSVVAITTEMVQPAGIMGQYLILGAGSGVIISADGYVVTNYHVIDEAMSITVHLNNGEEYQALVVGQDIRTDVALLKIEATDLQPAVFGDSDDLTVGEVAVAIGNPLGELGGTLTEGVVSALDRELVINGENMSLLQTSAAVNPGNSGGGLFNNRGELIGIVNAKPVGINVEGLGFAIPMKVVSRVVEQIIMYGYVQGRPDLGVMLLDISDLGMAVYYQVQHTGVYVLQVEEQSDLRVGDRLLRIGGEEVGSIAEVRKVVDNYAIGDIVDVKVHRGDNLIDVEITLVEAS